MKYILTKHGNHSTNPFVFAIDTKNSSSNTFKIHSTFKDNICPRSDLWSWKVSLNDKTMYVETVWLCCCCCRVFLLPWYFAAVLPRLTSSTPSSFSPVTDDHINHHTIWISSFFAIFWSIFTDHFVLMMHHLSQDLCLLDFHQISKLLKHPTECFLNNSCLGVKRKRRKS